MKDNTIAIVEGLAVAAFIAKLAYDERKEYREQQAKQESEQKAVFRVPDGYQGR